MNDQKPDHDLLIEIRQDVKHLKVEFEKISNGVGFPRCAARGIRLDTMEKRQEGMSKALAWTWKGILLIPAVYVIGEIIKKLV